MTSVYDHKVVCRKNWRTAYIAEMIFQNYVDAPWQYKNSGKSQNTLKRKLLPCRLGNYISKYIYILLCSLSYDKYVYIHTYIIVVMRFKEAIKHFFYLLNTKIKLNFI